MPRRINEVENIGLAIGVLVAHLNGVALDGDASFPFEVHVVQRLIFHVPFGDGFGELQEPVGQGALAVVNMGDDAEISDVFHAELLMLHTCLSWWQKVYLAFFFWRELNFLDFFKKSKKFNSLLIKISSIPVATSFWVTPNSIISLTATGFEKGAQIYRNFIAQWRVVFREGAVFGQKNLNFFAQKLHPL